MIATIYPIDDKKSRLVIDFNDEGVQLVGETEVIDNATSYAPFFEADLRRNNAELFPVPEIPELKKYPEVMNNASY